MRILREQLDPEQAAIALASDDSTLVLAGPGSGKTRLLVNVAAYQARRRAASRGRVLCLTFGVEAAQQMRQRLRDRTLGVPPGRRITVANFHQLGAELLRAYGDRLGLPRHAEIIGRSEQLDLLSEALTALQLQYVNTSSALEAISRLRNERTDVSRSAFGGNLLRISEAYDQLKRDAGMRDYDDLVLQAVELLSSDERIRRHVQTMYEYCVVDEMQDTSGKQLEFIALLSGEGNTPIFAVADNDQMIYGWRDARPENLSEFIERFGARQAELLGNYRCPPHIVAAANQIIRPLRPDDELPYSWINDRNGQVLVREVPWGVNEEGAIAEVVLNEISRWSIRPEHIAVLSGIRFKYADLQTAMEGYGIPAVVVGSEEEASRPFVRLMQAAVTVRARGADSRPRERLTSLVSAVVLDETAVEPAVRRLTTTPTLEECLAVSAELCEMDDDDPAVQRVRRIVRLASTDFGRDMAATAQRLRIEWTRLDARVRREESSVKLMTTFGAKGLEFHTVVLPYFDRGLAPYQPRGVQDTPAWRADERRKTYVAMTRAECRLVIVFQGQASEYLAELPQSTLGEWRAELGHEAAHLR